MWSIFTLIRKEKICKFKPSFLKFKQTRWMGSWKKKEKMRERKNPKIINNILVLDLRVGDA